MTLPAGTTIGKYVVRRKLAEGGMAEIYLCNVQGPEGFEKEVVIKRVRAFLASDPAFVQMFIAEARVASRLNHPNLVQIFDFDKHQDTFYLAMEYVHGHSLWDVRRRARERMVPMPPTLVAQIGASVARGLHYAHRLTERGVPLGLVHRDVTPHNVLLSFDGAVKLTDFGIAKAGNKLTSPGMLKGKFAYMSPEQARGEEVDCRTDLFALGIVLWEMLTGGRLFDGDSDVAVLRAVQQSAIAPPARLNPDVPAELDAAVMRALSRDPAGRFQTAQELERALSQVVMSQARRPEETDVSLYLAQLYEEELARGEPSQTEPSPSSAPELSATAPPREPTAVMRRAGSAPEPSAPTPSSPQSPDEDVNGRTLVIDRSRKSAPSAPTPPLASPEHGRPSTSLGVNGGGTTEPAPPSTPPPRATPEPALAREDRSVLRRSVGMRRGLMAGTAAFVLLAGAAVVVAVQAGRARVAREQALGEGGAVDAGAVAVAQPEPDVPVAAADLVRPEPAAEEPAPARPAAVELGTLVITVRPWATVLIDGESRGEIAGSRRIKLPAGPHQLRVVHPSAKRKEVVVIKPGAETVAEYDLMAR